MSTGMEGKAQGSPPPGKAAKPPVLQARKIDAVWQYATNCYLTVENNVAKLVWDNGFAVEATKGASVDYIEKHFYIHLIIENNAYKYAPFSDLHSMVQKGVPFQLAWIIVSMRHLVLGLTQPKVNAAEMVVVKKDIEDYKMEQANVDDLKTNELSYNAIINMTFTILALNGVGLIQQGHHYTENMSAYNRLEEAAALMPHYQKLRIPSRNVDIYRTALHVFDYDWVAGLVTKNDSEIINRVNGVASTRMPAIPAGCTSVNLALAMATQVAVMNPDVYDLVTSAVKSAEAFLKEVEADPLSYCVHFKRTKLAENKDKIAYFERIAAFLYGYLTEVSERKTTLLRARALGNISGRHNAEYLLGIQAGEVLRTKTKDADELTAAIKTLVASLTSKDKGKQEV